MSDFHALVLSKIKRETPNAVVLSFELPESLKSAFNFLPGQYITIKHEHNGNEIRRAYSLCSTPTSGLLQVGVKKVDGGSFSVFANETLRAGAQLEIMAPQGKFTVKTNTKNTVNYAAFAAGSGITPILSIIQSVLEEEPKSTFLLVYGNKTQEETMFFEYFEELKAQFPDRLHLEYVFSRENKEGAQFGRIEQSTVNFMLKNKYKDTAFDAFYLCGPESMIDIVTSTLKDKGVNEKQIHFELFTTSEEGLLVAPHDGDTSVTLTLDDETTSFTMPQAKSVLQAALDAGLDAPFSCQGGICSTCIARVVEGKVEMRKNQILTDGELADGLVLTCQSHPTTPTLVIDYDDV